MKKIVLNIIAWMLAAVITISTSGFMVFVHHCHHHQETFASVFVNFNNHDHHDCPEIPKSCCELHSEVPVTHCDTTGCCQEEFFLAKISPDTEPAKTSTVKLQSPELAIPASSDSYLSVKEELHSGEIRRPPPEMPPLSGKFIVILFSQIKADLTC
jgi:hypothetical protein